MSTPVICPQVLVFGIWVARLDWVAAAQRVREDLIAHGEAPEVDSDEETGTAGYPSLPSSPGWKVSPAAGGKAGNKPPLYLPASMVAEEQEEEAWQQEDQEQRHQQGLGRQQGEVGQSGEQGQQEMGSSEEASQAAGQAGQQHAEARQEGLSDEQAGQKQLRRLRQGDASGGRRATESSHDSHGSDSPFAAVAQRPFGEGPS